MAEYSSSPIKRNLNEKGFVNAILRAVDFVSSSESTATFKIQVVFTTDDACAEGAHFMFVLSCGFFLVLSSYS